MTLQDDCYLIQDPGWEAVARFDSVKADRAYFGDPQDTDSQVFVSEEAVASGKSTIEPVVLEEALTVDVSYDVASEWWEGMRRLTYLGPGPPSLRFRDEDGTVRYVPAHTVWVAFLT